MLGISETAYSYFLFLQSVTSQAEETDGTWKLVMRKTP